MKDIKAKRVYEPASSHDGFRVLVDRVWPRGLKKEQVHADLWLKEAAPSTDLRKWFGHDPTKWKEFKSRYFSELDANPEVVKALLDEVTKQQMTLLFSAHDTEHNQAVALKEYLLSPSKRK